MKKLDHGSIVHLSWDLMNPNATLMLAIQRPEFFLM